MTRRLLQAACAAAIALVASAGQARADDLGVYTVHACPKGGSGISEGWTAGTFGLDSSTRGPYSDCPSTFFGVDLSGGALSDGASASWTFRAPPFAYLSRVTWERRVQAAGPVVYDLFDSPRDTPLESSVPTRAPQFATPNGLWESRFADLIGGESLTVRLRCEAGAGSSCPPGNREVSFRNMRIDVVDGAAPIVIVGVAAPDGSAQPTDSLTLYASAIDLGSGAESIAIHLDGREVATASNAGGSCALPYFVAQPCPLSASTTVTLPRAVFAAGFSQIRVVATDAAGSTFESSFPLSRFGYGAPPQVIQVPGPATTATTRPIVVSALFASPQPGGPTAYAKPPTVRGSVRDADGKPMRDTDVHIETRPLVERSTFARAGSVRTDASGAFTWKVPRGPSREIRFTAANTSAFSSAALQLSVNGPIALKANRARTRNGRSVRFSGTIVDAPVDAHTRVELQAWAGRWVPFANATVRRGRFSAQYTFKRTLAPTTYRFRAVLPSDPNFPYAAATSKQVRVRVVP